MRLSPDEKKELRDLRAVFEANGGRGIEDADRIDELERKARLVKKVITVKLDVLVDPDTAPLFTGFLIQPYLDEILGLPQPPDETPDEGYWVIAARVA